MFRQVAFFSLLTLSFTAAPDDHPHPRRSDSGICSLWLTPGILKLDRFRTGLKMPFNDGLALDLIANDERIIFREGEIDHFLRSHLNFLWYEELINIKSSLLIKTDQLLYLSDLGPTLWSQNDFRRWLALQISTSWNDVKSVAHLLRKISAGHFVEGLSPSVARRFQGHPFFHESDRAHSSLSQEILWWGRFLLREPLVRRLIGSTHERFSDDEVFLFSAFPELLPYRALVQKWALRFDPLYLRADSGYFPLSLGPVNAVGDRARLALEHDFIQVGEKHQEVTLATMRFSGRKLLPEALRLNRQMENEFGLFNSMAGLPIAVPQLIHEGGFSGYITLTDTFGVHPILPFFFFLSQRYPVAIDLEREPVSM